MAHIVHLMAKKGNKLNEEKAYSYRRLIHRLIYLTNTHPDMSFSGNHLSQFIFTPTSDHYQVVMHVLKYVKASLGVGIFLHSNNTIQLKAYSDSDWAICPETRKSIIGFCVYLGNTIISWKSKKQ